MDPEVGEVVWAWLGGAVPEPRRASLLLRLRTDAAFRLAFVEEVRMLGMLKVVRSGPPRWLRLEDLLGWSADAGHKSTTSLADAVTARIRTLPRPGRPDPAPPRRPWSLVALLFLGAIAAVIPFHRPGGPPREGVAVAVRVAGTEWAGGGVSEGGVVGPGPLVLRRGAVTLAFHNGVTAHVEGPADVDVVSAGGVFCHRGRIRVEVPRGATGFTVAAPGTCVGGAGVDYELAVDGGRAEVTVFGGRPVVTAAAGGDRPAATPGVGEFVRVDPRTGHLSAPAMKLAAMQAPPDTPVLLLAPDYAKAVLADRPAGYWRFESVTNGVIPNEVSGGTGLRLIGAPSLHGPAGGNRGLYFPPAGGPHGALSEGVCNPTGR
ncbi:hypothetical protein J0H58_32490 [bacterium]|nr:hypothetical protein [bacterium]